MAKFLSVSIKEYTVTTPYNQYRFDPVLFDWNWFLVKIADTLDIYECPQKLSLETEVDETADSVVTPVLRIAIPEEFKSMIDDLDYAISYKHQGKEEED